MTVATIFAENVGWVSHTEKLLHNHVLSSGGIVSEIFYRSDTEQTDQWRLRIFPGRETPRFGVFWVQNYRTVDMEEALCKVQFLLSFV